MATTGLSVGLGSLASFALARYTFKGREAFFGLFMVGLLFPAGVASLPLYLWLRKLGLLENLMGVALPEAAFSLPYTIFILRPFLRAVPGELEDAAVVDGASRFKFFRMVLIPLSRPALTTVAILAFIWSWNAYLLPLLVFNDPIHYTLPARRGELPDHLLPKHSRNFGVRRTVHGPGACVLRPGRAPHCRQPCGCGKGLTGPDCAFFPLSLLPAVLAPPTVHGCV